MIKKTKGEYGYITKSKKRDVVMMLLYLAIALGIFVTGLLLNKMSYVNVFTILAIMFVLPWARVLVEFIVFFPYKTPKREDYDKVAAVMTKDAVLASDIVITSEEKSMGLDFVVMGNGYIFGLIMNEKQNADEIQKYLRKGVYNWSDLYQVKIHRHLEDFLKDVSCAKEKDVPEKQRESVESFIYSLVV